MQASGSGWRHVWGVPYSRSQAYTWCAWWLQISACCASASPCLLLSPLQVGRRRVKQQTQQSAMVKPFRLPTRPPPKGNGRVLRILSCVMHPHELKGYRAVVQSQRHKLNTDDFYKTQRSLLCTCNKMCRCLIRSGHWPLVVVRGSRRCHCTAAGQLKLMRSDLHSQAAWISSLDHIT